MKSFVSIQVNVGGPSFAPAFESLRKRGLTSVQSLSLDWSRVETAPSVFNNPLPAIANAYYPAQNTKILLILRPLNTVGYEVPSDLKGVAFDDLKLIARFEKQLDWILQQMPKTNFAGIALGNEIGGVLGENESAWRAYTRFFAHMAAYTHSKKPGVPVGVCVEASTWLGPQRRRLEAIHQSADQLFLNYYPLKSDFTVKPLEDVRQELDALTALAKRLKKPALFTEIGCPSAEACGSNEVYQTIFTRLVRELLSAPGTPLTGALVEWYRDNPAADVAEQVRYYGVSSPAFRGFLASLGLSHADGREKPALLALTA